MEFTKQQRHEIYKKALEYHLNDRPPYAMCFQLKLAIDGTFFGKTTIDDMLKILPEFAAIRPIGFGDGYWWDENDKDIRTKYYKQLIEETK